ncbi:hypothetical protein SAMN04488036_101634 [Shimia haliotis]|uniref:Uncharacterized protein n=1 Tax=Shimia haliotis TaxID=1280847 RepID=A0A1I4AVU7_9RHOB|nr:hypothetical protein SAMN04488036_101634 [Shimia haliotis]
MELLAEEIVRQRIPRQTRLRLPIGRQLVVKQAVFSINEVVGQRIGLVGNVPQRLHNDRETRSEVSVRDQVA